MKAPPGRTTGAEGREADPAHRRIAWAYGLVCHALFALGVGAMIAGMFFGMARALGTLRPPASHVANAALLLQFPLVHSFLLSRPGGRLLARLSPRAVARDMATTTYAAVAGLQTALLFLGWSPSGTVWWQATGAAFAALCALYAASWLLLLKAIADAGLAQQVGWLGWRAVALGRPVRYPPMPTRGLFRLCRQPIYLAFALTLWTVPTWTPDQLAVALVLTGYCLLGPLFKEARFARRFGPAFAEYRAAVRYWLPLPRRRP